MSNDLLREEFFNNPNVPNCEKLGVLALIGCGTAGQHTFKVGNEQSFGTKCPKMGGGSQFVAFSYGRPESLIPMLVNSCLHSIGFTEDQISRIFKSMSDEEVCSEARTFFRVAAKVDKSIETSKYEALVENDMNELLKKLRNTDPYLTEHPQIVNNLQETIKKSFGAVEETKDPDDSKKKQ